MRTTPAGCLGLALHLTLHYWHLCVSELIDLLKSSWKLLVSVMSVFISSKGCCWSLTRTKFLLLTPRSLLGGSHSAEQFRINFSKQFTCTKNCRIPSPSVGAGIGLIAITLLGFSFTPSLVRTWPMQGRKSNRNLHVSWSSFRFTLLALVNSIFSLRLWSCIASSWVAPFLYTKI